MSKKNSITPLLIGVAALGGGYLLWRSRKDGNPKEGSIFVPGVPGSARRTEPMFNVTREDLNAAMPDPSETGPWWETVERGASTTASRSYRWAILSLREPHQGRHQHVIVFVGESPFNQISDWAFVSDRVEAMALIQEQIESL